MVAKVIPLSLMGQELNNAIENLQANLESYITNRDMRDMLQACVEQADQLRGIFKLTLFVSAETLLIELHEIFQNIEQTPEGDYNALLAISIKAVDILNRYLIFLQDKDLDTPELLLPIINEIRALVKKPNLSESYFYTVAIDTLPDALADQPVEANITPETIRRIRHMYQVGLTNVIRDDNVAASARMMLRSAENIQRYSGNLPFAYLWWVVKAVLLAISEGALHLNRPRKMLLGQLDRQFKAAEQQWDATSQQQPPTALLKDLLFLVAIVGRDIGNVSKIKQAFALPEVVLSDAAIIKQQRALLAVSQNIKEISATAKSEIAILKDKLENLAALDDVLVGLTNIKEALEKAELHTPAKVLGEQLAIIKGWQAQGVTPTSEDLIPTANAILYVESTLNTLGSALVDAADESDTELLEEQKNKIIANSQLQDAHRILLVEAQAAVVEAIRQATAYVESDYDKNSLLEINSHLKSASGGLLFMKLDRAAKIVDGCVLFFDKEILNASDRPSQQKLDAAADALTALEYYLGGLMEGKRYGEGMLDVAEEGLQTLGHLQK